MRIFFLVFAANVQLENLSILFLLLHSTMAERKLQLEKAFVFKDAKQAVILKYVSLHVTWLFSK